MTNVSLTAPAHREETMAPKLISSELHWLTITLSIYFVSIQYISFEIHTVITAVIGMAATLACFNKFRSNLPIIIGGLFILTISLVSSLFNHYDAFNNVKGFYYLSRPLIYVFTGSAFILIFGERRIINAIILAAFLASLVYIFKYHGDPLASINGRTYSRLKIGVGSFSWAIAIAVLTYGAVKHRYFINAAFHALVLTICVYALYLSDSRSYMLATAALTLILFSPSIIIKTGWIVSLSIVSLTIAISTPLLEMIGIPVPYRFISNLPLIGEMAPIQVNNFREMNINWRGFETRSAFEFLSNSAPHSLLFGRGLGSSLDLNYTFVSGSTSISNIPVFHNGYSLISMKSGLIGLATYSLCLVIATFFMTKRASLNPDHIKLIGIGCIIFAAYSTATTSGYYNGGESGALISFVIGAASTTQFVRRVRHRRRGSS